MTRHVFSDKLFYQVNREERNYCALIAHALLMSRTARSRFAELCARHLNVRLDPGHLEIFVEVAALRDYWNDLGDPQKYTAETHQRRLYAVQAMLKHMGVKGELIDRYDFFWTKGVGSKLWSPGAWQPAKLRGELDPRHVEALWRLRWAFNSKPDMLIISDAASLLIEAKLESGESQHGDRGQREPASVTRKRIADLLNALVPQFRTAPIHLATLNLRGAKSDRPATFSWAQVAECCDLPEVDEFTRRCLKSLGRYKPPKVR